MKKQLIILLVLCGIAVAEEKLRAADNVDGEAAQNSAKIAEPKPEPAEQGPPPAEPVMPEAALDAVSRPASVRWVMIFDVEPKPDAPAKNRLSVGGGAFFAGDFGGGLLTQGGKALLTTPYYGGGAHLFFDAIYAEIFIGYSAGGGKWKWGSNKTSDRGPSVNMRREYLNSGIFAKYPFDAGAVSVFPLLGIDYERSVSFEVELPKGEKFTFKRNSANADVLSALWFKFGGGLDVGLSRNAYARLQLLYGFRTVNNMEEDLIELDSARKANPGNGLTFSIGGGVKF